MPAQRWEAGAAFPYLLPAGDGWVAAPDPARWYGSGRQALRALLEFGHDRYGWTAVHLPTYYCPEVTAAVGDVLRVQRYACGPTRPGAPVAVGPREVVVTVGYFGAPPPIITTTGAALIVDATHDPLAPWLRRTGTDYVFTSLRKTLPVPDGGALWSPAGRELPAPRPVTTAHLATVAGLLSAMCLKTGYLSGAVRHKEEYLALFDRYERGIGASGVSGISEFTSAALGVLPVADLRRRRTSNAVTLAASLTGLPGVNVRATTFGVILECDTHRLRETLRAGLIRDRVYPAVLWPDASESPAAADDEGFSRRMLLLHTDFRLGDEDLRRLAAVVWANAEGAARPRRPLPVPR
jgi:hypothetical protein